MDFFSSISRNLDMMRRYMEQPNMKPKKSTILLFSLLVFSLFQSMLLSSPNDSPEGSDESEEFINESIHAEWDLTIKAQADCVDAWILIEGSQPDPEERILIHRTMDFVYMRLRACGKSDEEIYYIQSEGPGIDPDADALTSLGNIEYAFTTWAPSMVGSDGVLGVYMLGPGHNFAMCIHPNGLYTANQFDEDVDSFQSLSGCDRVIIIYDAPGSGAFIDDLSQSDRIILTSTAASHGAWFSPYFPHFSLFGKGLFSSIMAGNSLGDAFVDATDAIEAVGYEDYQIPMIDDNHDGVGHAINDWGWIPLPHGGDGLDALNTYVCKGCSAYVAAAVPPAIAQAPLKWWIVYSPSVISFPITVMVANDSDIAFVTCRVVHEDWAPPVEIVGDEGDPAPLGSWDGEEDVFQLNLTRDAVGNYSGEFSIVSPVRDSDYKISLMVEDVNGIQGPIVSTSIGVNTDGIAPADTVAPVVVILRPFDDTTVEGVVEIIAEGSDENSGLTEIQIYVNDVLKGTTTMPEYLPYPEATFALNTSEYANGDLEIMAKATDAAGNTDTFTITVEVNNTAESDTTPADTNSDSGLDLSDIPGYPLGMIALVGLFGIIFLVRKSQK